MTEQKYRAVVRTADGRQMYGTLIDIASAREEVSATFTEDRIEHPVPMTGQGLSIVARESAFDAYMADVRSNRPALLHAFNAGWDERGRTGHSAPTTERREALRQLAREGQHVAAQQDKREPAPTIDMTAMSHESIGFCFCGQMHGRIDGWDEHDWAALREYMPAVHQAPNPSLPTREQIAEALFQVDHGPDARWRHTPQVHHEYLVYADAVLALIQKGTER